MAARFEVFNDAGGKWRWRLIDGNNENVATSGESFASRSNALRAARNVKVTAPNANLPSMQSSQSNSDDLLSGLLELAERRRARRIRQLPRAK